MIRKIMTAGCVAVLLFSVANQAMAHFGMVIPSENIVTQQKRSVDITLSFSHPFEKVGMELDKPAQFYVARDGKRADLLATLKEKKVMDHKGWQTTYTIKRPGVYHFVMEPKPYWEPSEDVSIIHYTKTIVAAYGGDEGWDNEVGLPTEIVPLLRPFGNYVGNSFVGKVLMNGKPVPHADVEVEFYNRAGSLKAPSDHHITQLVKADKNGIFTFTCSQAGWWGFAALNEAEYTLKNPKGEAKGVELGAVLWIYMDEYRTK